MTEQNGDDILIAEIPKNTREILRIALSEYKGSKLLHSRVWTRGTEQSLPTKSGYAINVNMIAQLRQALDDAEKEAVRIGWLQAK